MNLDIKIPPSKKYKKKIIIFLSVLLFVAIVILIAVLVHRNATKVEQHTARNMLVVVVLDGFRHDYLKNKSNTPNLNALARRGVKTTYMRPRFPTVTFPNLHTLFTGLNPESHGIVGNIFYDKNLNATFDYRNASIKDSRFYGGETIWVTAKKNGLKSVEILSMSDGITTKIDRITELINLPMNKRPSLITVYFGEPDSKGHEFGPLAIETINKVKEMDDHMGNLIKQFSKSKVKDNFNLVVTSDHGMIDGNCRYLFLDINNTDVKTADKHAYSHLYTESNETAYQLYQRFECSNNHLMAYSKRNYFTPKRWHFTNNERIGNIVLEADLNWQFVWKNDSCDFVGYHGNDNIHDDLQTIFLAAGADFKENYTFEHIENVELYNLFADLLRVKPAPNNGSYGSLHHVLKDEIVKELTESENINFEEQDFCFFPDNFNESLKNCDSCTCPYCGVKNATTLELYRKNLNLSKSEVYKSHERHFPLSLPRRLKKLDECILTQHHYVTGYNRKLHLPSWVGYELTKEQLLTDIKRVNCFRKDLRLTNSNQALCDDYSRSGYDRGHLAPSGDFNFDEFAMHDTNMLTNIAPQHRYLNRQGGINVPHYVCCVEAVESSSSDHRMYSGFSIKGGWYYLEDLTRQLALRFDKLYVISGVIFDENNDGIVDDDNIPKRWLQNNYDSVAIPTHFYKILLKCNTTTSLQNCPVYNINTLAFILPHNEEKLCQLRSTEGHVLKHVSTIKDIEILTGLTFFSRLKQPDQARLKSRIVSELWS